MTDRELLELAAKAAGIEIFDDEFGDTCRVYYTDPSNGLKRYTRWNPLTDDGDALRLAVKCGISIDIMWDGENDQYDPVIANYNGGRERFEEQMGFGFDDMAATRRAIVRAAAEIGKAMP